MQWERCKHANSMRKVIQKYDVDMQIVCEKSERSMWEKSIDLSMNRYRILRQNEHDEGNKESLHYVSEDEDRNVVDDYSRSASSVV